MKKLSFSVFADFHYENEVNGVSTDDLQQILDRAKENKVDFVIHCGDFCKQGITSLQLFDTYFNNGLRTYGIYGNHELEGSVMPFTTPRLTNDREVVWGTEDGKIGDGYTAYYYFDINGYRIVCTDTNYSYSASEDKWVHNERFSWGPPRENIPSRLYNALGPKQLKWLENVLADAAEKDLTCIVFSHATFCPLWKRDCCDDAKVREIFARINAKKPKTVIAAINGHYHTNHMGMVDGIFYFDVNSRDGEWKLQGTSHYTKEHTFIYNEYNCYGEKVRSYERELSTYHQADKSWHYADPLNAIVTVNGDDEIIVEGMESDWRFGIAPEHELCDGMEPRISSGTFKIG